MRRPGIYRVAASGGRSIRLTNDCVVQGSSGPDRLEGGEFSDILVGGGGDDVLTASTTSTTRATGSRAEPDRTA
jgi:Ca2+-binding RTX toxin-like protein